MKDVFFNAFVDELEDLEKEATIRGRLTYLYKKLPWVAKRRKLQAMQRLRQARAKSKGLMPNPQRYPQAAKVQAAEERRVRRYSKILGRKAKIPEKAVQPAWVGAQA